jgi:hypothetical protein
MKIKQGKAAAVQLGNEFNADNNLAELLQPVCPQPEQTPSGVYYFAPDEVQLLDQLFQRFGLQFRSSDDRFDDVDYVTGLWYKLCAKLGSHIECSWYSPKLFAVRIEEMPADFRHYIVAVKEGNQADAQRLATQLEIENLDAFCIEGMFGA